MRFITDQLLSELKQLTERHLQLAEEWKNLPEELKHSRPKSGGWNMLECLEHLNLYGDYYLAVIQSAIGESKYPSSPVFRSGIIGNWFTNMMKPGPKMKKMKTFKDKNPEGKALPLSVMDRFSDQQHRLLRLLEAASQTDLTKVKTPISISRFIRLRLGDTLRFVVYHNQRHIEQAERVLAESGASLQPA